MADLMDFLKKEEVLGEKALRAFDGSRLGIKAVPSDFARCMGPQTLSADDTWSWWLDASNAAGEVGAVGCDGEVGWCEPSFRAVGARPAMKFSDLESFFPDGYIGMNKDGVITWAGGNYPQKRVFGELAEELDGRLAERRLRTVDGEVCTVDSNCRDRIGAALKPQVLPKYRLDGKLYTQCPVFGPSYLQIMMRDGEPADKNSSQWLEWQPIIWKVDTRNNRAFAEDILFSGVPVSNRRVKNIRLEDSVIGKFMRENFVKDAGFKNRERKQGKLWAVNLCGKENPDEKHI